MKQIDQIKNMLLGIAILLIAVLLRLMNFGAALSDFFALFGIGLVTWGYLRNKKDKTDPAE